jgi:hypothetical protein
MDIYARGCAVRLDAMKVFPSENDLGFTMSFRFGKKPADLFSVFIREAKGGEEFHGYQ